MDWQKYRDMMAEYIIDTPMRIAHFLAQCSHESQGFTRKLENLNYSAHGLAETWPRRYAVDPDAKNKMPNALALRLHRNPEAIANNVYGGRKDLGNGPESSGDGWKFRGHAFLQLTGQANIKAFADHIGRGIDETLEYMLTEPGAVEASCFFWMTHGLNVYADKGDVRGLTKKINPGLLGLKERTTLTERYKKELMA